MGWGQCKSPKFPKIPLTMLMNDVMEKIIEEAITTTDSDIISISSVLDAKDEKNL
jgi:hypothetical protein